MTGLEALRDDGPLARMLPDGRIPVPGVVLLGLAVPVALLTPTLGADPAWGWVLGGVALALLGRLGRRWARLEWPEPALLRALEYGAVVLLVGLSPWGYALLATVAFHHYDIVYRLRLRGVPPPSWVSIASGGWELRTSAVAVAAALDAAVPVVATLAVALAVLYVTEAVASWAPPREPRRTG